MEESPREASLLFCRREQIMRRPICHQYLWARKSEISSLRAVISTLKIVGWSMKSIDFSHIKIYLTYTLNPTEYADSLLNPPSWKYLFEQKLFKCNSSTKNTNNERKSNKADTKNTNNERKSNESRLAPISSITHQSKVMDKPPLFICSFSCDLAFLSRYRN